MVAAQAVGENDRRTLAGELVVDLGAAAPQPARASHYLTGGWKSAFGAAL